jgi:hypothetical protein
MIYGAILFKTNILDKSDAEKIALAADYFQGVPETLNRFLISIIPVVCASDALSDETLFKIMKNLIANCSNLDENLSAIIEAIVISFGRVIIRRQKVQNKDKKTFVDFELPDSATDGEFDVQEQYYKIASGLVFGDKEIVAKQISEDPILKSFYEKNKKVLAKVNPGVRVQDTATQENALPLILKQRFTLNSENRLLGPEFFSENSIDLPYKIIVMILDKTLSDTVIETSPESSNTSRIYPETFLDKFTYIGHRYLPKPYHLNNLHIIFMQTLFFMYGPDLIFKCEEWLKENFDETPEAMNCYCLWASASLYCSSSFDDVTFDRILSTILAPVPSF